MSDDDPRSLYSTARYRTPSSTTRRIDCLRVRRADVHSNIAVLERGGEPSAARLETLLTSLAGIMSCGPWASTREPSRSRSRPGSGEQQRWREIRSAKVDTARRPLRYSFCEVRIKPRLT